MANGLRCGIGKATLFLLVAAGCSDGDGSEQASAPARGDASVLDHPDASADAGSSPSGDPCPGGTLEGDYMLDSQAGADAIADCTEVTGTLGIGGDALTTLSLPSVEKVGGALEVKEATALTQLEFAALTTVGKELLVDGNPELRTFAAPTLATARTLLVTDNPKLESFDLDGAKQIATLGFQGDDALATVELMGLETVGTFVINSNATLEAVRFPALTEIDGDGFIILMNPTLSTLEMPVLETLIGDIAVNDNPMLPTCQIDAILSRLDAEIPVAANNNDDDATCD